MSKNSLKISITLKFIAPLFLLGLFFAFPSFADAAGCAGTGNCYWVGGTGNWSDTAHWATESGGATTGSVPTSTDNAIFDSGSNTTNAGYTMTVDATANMNDLNFSAKPGDGLGGTITWVITNPINMNVYGSLTALAGMSASGAGGSSRTINFKATSGTKLITSNGVSLNMSMYWNAAGGTWQIADTFSNVGVVSNVLTNGTLDFNNQNVTFYNFSTSSGTAVLSLGSSNITISGNTFSINSGTTVTAHTSTISFTNSSGATFSGGGKIYNNVLFPSTGNSSTGFTINGNNTFSNLTLDNTLATIGRTHTIFLGGDQTVNGTFSSQGNSVINRIFIGSTVKGTPRTITAANILVSNTDFQDITGAGDASWDLSAGISGNAGGNTMKALGDAAFTTPKTWYFHEAAAGTDNWSTVGKWFTETNGGGSVATYPPLPQDTARFDSNSFDAGSKTVTQDMPRIGSVDWTGATNTPTWTTSTDCSVFGSITLIPGMLLTASTQTYTFEGRGSNTLDSAGLTWEKPITLNMASSDSLTLKSNLTMRATKTLTVTSGTLSAVDGANNWAISAGKVSVASSNAAVLTLGSATHLITGTSSILWSFGASGVLTANTATIKFTGALVAHTHFAGGGKTTYYNVWNATTNAYQMIIEDSNTFNNFKSDAGRTNTFTAGTTQTFSSFNAIGTLGNPITLDSTGTTFNLVKTGGGRVSADYLSVSRSAVTPANTWYSGANSTVDGTNSGWTLSSPPSQQIIRGIFKILGTFKTKTSAL